MSAKRMLELAETAEHLAASVPTHATTRTSETEPWELGVLSLWMACYGAQQKSPMDPVLKNALVPNELQPVHENLFQVTWNAAGHHSRHEWDKARERLTALAKVFRAAAARASESEPRATFAAWLRGRLTSGERLLLDDLAAGPRHYFYEKQSSDYAHEFYTRIDKWRGWASGLVTGLRRRLRNAEHIWSDALKRFDESRLLVFRIPDFHDPTMAIDVDLGDRRRFLDGAGWLEIRAAFQDGRSEEPSWISTRDMLLKELRAFVAMVLEQVPDLDLVDEGLTAQIAPAAPLTAEPADEPVANRSRFTDFVRIGEGAFGEVWRANDTKLKRCVAIKFLRSTNATTTEVVRNARALTRVAHANIVTLYDVTYVPDPQDGRSVLALVMEWIDGETLQERLQRAVSILEATKIGYALLDAVGEYHQRGLAHFDLHGENVIVGAKAVKVLDPIYEASQLYGTGLHRAQKGRDLRSLRDLLCELLQRSPLSVDACAHFERETRGGSLEVMRNAFAMAVAAAPND